MLKACVADRPAGRTVYNGALWSARKPNQTIPAEVLRGWRLLARAAASSRDDNRDAAWYVALERLSAGDVDHAVREAAVDALASRAMATRPRATC